MSTWLSIVACAHRYGVINNICRRNEDPIGTAHARNISIAQTPKLVQRTSSSADAHILNYLTPKLAYSSENAPIIKCHLRATIRVPLRHEDYARSDK